MNAISVRYALILIFVGTIPCPAQASNLLKSAADITNSAWQIGGTGCARTTAQVYMTTGHPCSLSQELSVSAHTTYTTSMVLTITSGTNQAVTLNLFTESHVVLCSQTVTLNSSPQLLGCTASSGVNTNILMEMDTTGAVSSAILVANSALSPYELWSMGYYTPYASGSYPSLKDIDWTALTHVIMVGGEPNADGTISLPNDFEAAATTLISTARANGIKVLYCLSASVTGMTHFTATITNKESTFIANIMSTVSNYGFDGVDIDDEESWNASLMSTFLGDLRTALGAKILTFASGNYNNKNWDASHSAYVDRVNILTYDAGTGTSTPYSWFNSPLNTGSDNCCDSVSFDVNLFSKNSLVPPSKLGIGLAFYGVLSTGGAQTGPYQRFGTPPSFKNLNYDDIITNYSTSNATYDSIAHVPWLTVTGGWINWDNPQSISEKIAYTKTNNLGGWVIWYLGADDFPSQIPAQPLLNALKVAMRPAPPTNVLTNGIN